jgi:hypothetical protein
MIPDDEDQTDLFGAGTDKPARNKKTMTRSVRRIIDASADLMDEPPDINQADFLHAILCQVGMPRRAVKERIFERENGATSMVLEAGRLWNGKGRGFKEYPLPYGAKPRLVMVHIGTQAVRTRSKEVEIGNSTHDFIKELGFDTSGRGYAYFRTQMLSLAACRMTLGWDAHGRAKTLETKPIEQFEAWLHPTGRQAVMWPGVLVLSERFYETMLEYAVPLSHSALSALKDSALALDVYSWLAHRLCRINKAKGVKVSWKNLREQFGQEYADPRNFKKAFRDALRRSCAVYHDARIEDTTGGLLLLPSKPPIPKIAILIDAS